MNLIDCVNISKRSEATNQQDWSCTELNKTQFFPVSIVKKHLAYQVQEAQKTKFPLPLNVSYRHQTIKLAVGAMTEPLYTYL